MTRVMAAEVSPVADAASTPGGGGSDRRNLGVKRVGLFETLSAVGGER